MFKKCTAFFNKLLSAFNKQSQSELQVTRSVNLIYVGFGFGVFYWIMESVRDVLVYDRGTILERIFIPGFMSFWMRMLIICIILLFSVYAQTIRKKHKTKSSKKQSVYGLFKISLIFGLLYWIIEAFRDAFIFNKGGFFEQLISPDPAGFWMRLLPLLILILFGIYAQSLIDDQKKIEEDLQRKKIELQDIIKERTEALLKSNQRLQKEYQSKDKAQKELERVNRALRTLSACNKSLVNAENEDDLIKNLCFLLVDIGHYDFVFVAYYEDDNPSHISIKHMEGNDRGYLSAIHFPELNLPNGYNPLKEIKEKGLVQMHHFNETDSNDSWIAEAVERGIKSCICLPLFVQNKTIGLLAIFSMHHVLDDEEENDLITEMAGDLAYGISIIRMKSEHDVVVQTLKESEEKYGTISENLDVGIFRYDLTNGGQFIEANPALIEMLKYSNKSQFLDKKITDLFQFQTDLRNIDEQMQKTGRVTDKEVLMKCDDGEPVWCSLTATAIYDENHNINYYDGVLDNISKRKALEKEKKDMQLQLFQAQKMEEVGVLAGGVAHDFNNILTAMLGISEIAMMTLDENEAIYKDMKEVYNLAQRGSGITRQLLIFSRKQNMEFDSVHLNEIIESMGKMLGRLMVTNVKLQNYLDDSLWPCYGDQGTLEQVIMNLVVNARDAMQDGGNITVRTENIILNVEQAKKIPQAYEGKFIKLSVQDEGTGIESAILKKIFEPFFSTKGVGKGTGLGLSVVFGIVKQHKGFMNINTVLSQGTTFEVYIPADPENKLAKTKEITDDSNKQANGEHVLFIEDDENIRECMVTGLKEKGYKVSYAGNAKEAMEIFFQEHGQFHYTLSDVVLPDENGFRLVSELLSYNPTMKVIMNSGYSDDKSCKTMIEDHGFRYLQKPFTFKQLIQAMDEIG